MRRAHRDPSTTLAALAAAAGLALPLAPAAGCAMSPRREPGGERPPSLAFRLDPGGVGAVDLLVVVDNSNGTLEMQTILADQFVLLARALIAPRRDPATGLVPPAVTDLHLGVVGIDMGTGGFEVMTCRDPVHGDDGLLLAAGRYEGCPPTYEAADCTNESCPWLVHSEAHPNDGRDPEDPPIWNDFGCIATLGTGGCGLEQPLESALAALTRQAEPGMPNHGFLRQGSIVAVLIVTDEDDCSFADRTLLDPDRVDLGGLNVRCALHPELLHPVSRYEAGFRGLRPDHPERVVVGIVAGVPIDGRWEPGDPLEDLEALVGLSPRNENELLPSCETAMGLFLPPPRLVDLAYRFGRSGLVASSCRGDWSETLHAFAGTIQRAMRGTCAPADLGLDEGGRCRVVETLASGAACGAGRLDLGLDEAGARRCELPGAAGSAPGWRFLPFDASDPVASQCDHGQIDLGGLEPAGPLTVECWTGG